MSSQMGHFLGPDDSSEIEPFDPEALQYDGSTTTGTPSTVGRKAKQTPVIVSSSAAGSSNGRNGSRSSPKSSPNKPKQKTRDSDCCSINFIKYSLHIFNAIFLEVVWSWCYGVSRRLLPPDGSLHLRGKPGAIPGPIVPFQKMSGMVIVGVTLWTVFWKHQYISLLSTTNYAIGTYALLAAGLLAVVGGVLGCCGVCHEHRGILLMYTFILLFVFLLEAIVGGLAYLYETQIEAELQHSLNSTFVEHYGVSERQTKAIDSMQQEFSCCGAVRFEDWRNSVWLRSRRKDLIRPTEGRLVPDSCCVTVSPLCGLRDGPSNIHYTGCIYQMTDDVKHHLIILGAIGLGLSVIQIFGMILSCCLYVKLKNVLD